MSSYSKFLLGISIFQVWSYEVGVLRQRQSNGIDIIASLSEFAQKAIPEIFVERHLLSLVLPSSSQYLFIKGESNFFITSCLRFSDIWFVRLLSGNEAIGRVTSWARWIQSKDDGIKRSLEFLYIVTCRASISRCLLTTALRRLIPGQIHLQAPRHRRISILVILLLPLKQRYITQEKLRVS
jgi:hypothetical protein